MLLKVETLQISIKNETPYQKVRQIKGYKVTNNFNAYGCICVNFNQFKLRRN